MDHRLDTRARHVAFAIVLLNVSLVATSQPAQGTTSGAPVAQAPHTPNPRTAATIAERFIEALNAKSDTTMARLAERPFFYRSQEWETAKDGKGFELGAVNDRNIAGKRGLEALLRDLIARVKIEARAPATNPPAKRALLKAQLRGANPRWARLRLYVFLRGFGDVEHIAIVGVDPVRLKVAALYLN
jgi:hypothetical protein